MARSSQGPPGRRSSKPVARRTASGVKVVPSSQFKVVVPAAKVAEVTQPTRMVSLPMRWAWWSWPRTSGGIEPLYRALRMMARRVSRQGSLRKPLMQVFISAGAGV
ncbi:MAG: hypothetical protein R3F14_37705 [Polyangiaceae bacterium]